MEGAKDKKSITSARVISELSARLYDRPKMDNRERGDYAEQLVLSALGPDWKWVGLGWKPWDLERNYGERRVRIQVKQSAMAQFWQRPEKLRPGFAIVKR